MKLGAEILKICEQHKDFRTYEHCSLTSNNFTFKVYTSQDHSYYTFKMTNFMGLEKVEIMFYLSCNAYSVTIENTNYNKYSVLTLLKILKKEIS